MNAAGRPRVLRVAAAALLLAPAMAIIAAGFLAPLIRLAALSVSAPAGPLAAYHELATVDVYRLVLKNTLVLALVVSAASLAIGFALALALTRLEPRWRTVIFACVCSTSALCSGVCAHTFAHTPHHKSPSIASFLSIKPPQSTG